MSVFHLLNHTYLDHFLITYNQEINHLMKSAVKGGVSTIDDTFYFSISKDENNLNSLATTMIKDNEDFVFDKQYVNPYFIQQNTTGSLLDAITFEEQNHQHCLDDTSIMITEAEQKMNKFKASQKLKREQEKLEQFKHAITEYKWLYSPKLISPFLKNFLHDCYQTEFVLKKFVETLYESGRELHVPVHSYTDCIFGYTLKDFLGDALKQHYFNKLFLPRIYNLPKQMNSNYVLNKYIHQFFPENVKIKNGTDTIHSLFFNTAKFKTVNESQTVAAFIKTSMKDISTTHEEQQSTVQNAIERLHKIQTLTILYLIMKTRCKNLKLKRAENGKISSITNEYIVNANTLYFHERDDMWSIYLSQHSHLFYSKNIFDIFFFILKDDHTETS